LDVWAIFLVFVSILSHIVLPEWTIIPLTAGLIYLHYNQIVRSWNLIVGAGGFTVGANAIVSPIENTIWIIGLFAIAATFHTITENRSEWTHDIGHALWHIFSAFALFILVL
jgi:hypothetical protein